MGFAAREISHAEEQKQSIVSPQERQNAKDPPEEKKKKKTGETFKRAGRLGKQAISHGLRATFKLRSVTDQPLIDR